MKKLYKKIYKKVNVQNVSRLFYHIVTITSCINFKHMSLKKCVKIILKIYKIIIVFFSFF